MQFLVLAGPPVASRTPAARWVLGLKASFSLEIGKAL